MNWTQYYSNHLNKYEINQLSKQKSSKLVTDYLAPLLHEQKSQTYIGVTCDVRSPARLDKEAFELASGKRSWNEMTYFMNPLSLPTVIDQTSTIQSQKYDKPMDRVKVTSIAIFTFEYDEKDDFDFFRHQLSLFRSKNNPLDAPIGKFLSDIRRKYSDIIGLTVNYSGNKSFHFHIVANTDYLDGRQLLSPRNGLITAWQRLSTEIANSPHLDLQNHQPDRQLRFPETYRRLPDGTRVLQKDNQFGVPAGTTINQTVVWEHLSKRSIITDDSTTLFELSAFQTHQIAHQKRSKRIHTNRSTIEPDLHRYLSERFSEHFTSYPKFSHLEYQNGSPAAYFHNSKFDQNPSSIMKANYRHIYLCGRDSETLDAKAIPSLPASLEVMLTRWIADYDELQNLRIRHDGTERTDIEFEFAKRATDYTTAQSLLTPILTDIVTDKYELIASDLYLETGGDQGFNKVGGKHWLCAPEGISKTRTILSRIKDIRKSLQAHNAPELIVYAGATYAAAKEKAREINEEFSQDGTYKAVVLESFQAVYQREAKRQNATVLTDYDFIQNGYTSLAQMIKSEQPAVWSQIEYHYLRNPINFRRKTGQITIICTVHAVVHQWADVSLTRLMSSQFYWSNDFNRAKSETEIGLLIHDEINIEDLVPILHQDEHKFVSIFKETATKSASIKKKFAAWQNISNKPPLDFRTTVEASQRDWLDIAVEYHAEYGAREHRDIYAMEITDNPIWFLALTDWHKTAWKTLVLTTEMVVTVIARATDWNVIQLDTPLIEKPIVKVTADKCVTAKRAKQIAQECRKQFPLTAIISDGVQDSSLATTHKTIKGSNTLMSSSIIQTMFQAHPAHYIRMEVLNTFFCRDDFMRMSHADQFNQTCGRNLGFRQRKGTDHILITSNTMFDCLASQPTRYSLFEKSKNAITLRQKKETAQ